MNAPVERWVSCSMYVDRSTGIERHLTTSEPGGWTDTFCGATGSPGAMRGNSRKPQCHQCLAEKARRS